VPASFTVGPREDEHLDGFLAQRFRGNFHMTGRRIWSDMRGVPDDLRARIGAFRQVVSVFTNVSWDTSQAYANALFADMFDWLGATLREAAARPDTLFIVRAHPDELRKGLASETVGDWLRARSLLDLPNVTFVPPDLPISSYELIGLSKFCAVYNSTVGLEAAVLGAYALAGGRTRYRGAGVCHEPASRDDYLAALRGLLDSPSPPSPPPEWRTNARRYLFFSLFRSSLDLSAFIEHARAHHFTLRRFPGRDLSPSRSREMRVIVDGILRGRPFHYD